MTVELFVSWLCGGLFGAVLGHMATIKDLRRAGYDVRTMFPWDTR